MIKELRVIDIAGTGPMYIDFRLGELRLVKAPSMAIAFIDLCEATKKEIRGIRSEFGACEYIVGLDD